jgi:hypothetical protein
MQNRPARVTRRGQPSAAGQRIPPHASLSPRTWTFSVLLRACKPTLSVRRWCVGQRLELRPPSATAKSPGRLSRLTALLPPSFREVVLQLVLPRTLSAGRLQSLQGHADWPTRRRIGTPVRNMSRFFEHDPWGRARRRRPSVGIACAHLDTQEGRPVTALTSSNGSRAADGQAMRPLSTQRRHTR